MSTEPRELSGLHIGASVRIKDANGWIHTGTLVNIEHSPAWRGDSIKTMVSLRSADGSRWIGYIEDAVEVES